MKHSRRCPKCGTHPSSLKSYGEYGSALIYTCRNKHTWEKSSKWRLENEIS
jgi:predicted nucleic-acid-binding Zn-ribbon protein